MNAYKFSYEGMWLGGTMIVIAPNKDVATKIAKEQLTNDEDIKTLELEEEISIAQARVILNDNGDY